MSQPAPRTSTAEPPGPPRPGEGTALRYVEGTPLSDFSPDPLPVCGQHRLLPEPYEDRARALAPPDAGADAYVYLVARCVLQAHTAGAHHAYVMHLDGIDTGAVWARWDGPQELPHLEVLPDCPARAPQVPDDACCLYARHPGAHSHELADPRDP